MRKVFLLVLIAAALRVWSAVSFPLFSVEAYYWLWGQYPAAGYFDHPPMVGWMSRLFFGWIVGNPLAARSGPIILSSLSTLALYAFARAMAPGGRASWRMALLAAFTPIFYVNGVLIQPDNSLLFFMSLTWLCFWRAAQRPEDGGARLGWWLAAGAAAGGALLSKFHAWALLPPLWLFLALSPAHRRLWRSPGPWLAAAVALLALSPNLLWNAQHNWMNYRFQFHRSEVENSQFEWRNPAIFLLGPLFTVSPVLYFGMAAAVWIGARRWLAARRGGAALDPRVIFLLLAGLPLPLMLGALSLGVTISLHWPAMGYPPLLLLMLILLDERAAPPPAGRRLALATSLSLAAMLAVMLIAPHVIRHLPADLHLPFRREMVNTAEIKEQMAGWPEIGARIRKLRDHYSARQGKPVVLFARTWHLAASLAFYARMPRDTFAFLAADAHNFELWRQERGGMAGVSGLIVYKRDPRNHKTLETKYDRYIRETGPLFDGMEPLPSLLCMKNGEHMNFMGPSLPGGPKKVASEYLMLLGHGFKGTIIPDTQQHDADKF